MADDKQRLIDFIKAYQDIRPETNKENADINPYKVDTREDFMQMVEGIEPKTKLPRDLEDRYEFVLPEDFEYMPTDERAKYFGYSGRAGGGREFPLEGISPFQTKDGKVASDIRNSDYGSDKNKRSMLEKIYSNRDKLSMGPRYKTLTEGKTPSYMLDDKGNRISNKELSKKYFTDYDGPMPMRKPEIEKAKAEAEKEKFVAKDTLLGRIFDKRVRPGEEISNRDKSSAILRNISDNLMERRLVGGKKGTDTLSRILGPSGGIRGGFEEIEALETASKSKKAAAVDKALERKKKAYEIQKISSESMKNIAELAKTDFTKATQEAMELAEFEGFEPGTLPFDNQVAAILRGAVTEGQANVYTKLMQLQKSLSILPKGSPEYIAMENDIAEMKQRVGGTTLDNSYAPEQVTDQYGNPIT